MQIDNLMIQNIYTFCGKHSSSKIFNWLSLKFALILQANWLRFNRQHLKCFLTVSYQALTELGRYLHKQDAS